MTIQEEVHALQPQLDALAQRIEGKSLQAYEVSDAPDAHQLLFVVDLDTSREEGYSDRFFDMLFGIQEISARPVELWELHIFERERQRAHVTPILLELKYAA